MGIKFSLYGRPWNSISLESLLEEQQKDGMLFAHGEDSGCESSYCEVAKWSNERKRWERYCFVKCLDYRLPEMPDASDEETADELARRINALIWENGRSPVVSRMPDADKPTDLEKYALELLGLIDSLHRHDGVVSELAKIGMNSQLDMACNNVKACIKTKFAAVS